jgi:hypothetical protein
LIALAVAAVPRLRVKLQVDRLPPCDSVASPRPIRKSSSIPDRPKAKRPPRALSG